MSSALAIVAGPVKEPTYKVVCISMYRRDLELVDELVAGLKARGFTRANRSWLLRVALSRLSVDNVERADALR